MEDSWYVLHAMRHKSVWQYNQIVIGHLRAWVKSVQFVFVYAVASSYSLQHKTSISKK